ncbi:hypothetical protein JZ751_013578, partial [Albula glossodonta]
MQSPKAGGDHVASDAAAIAEPEVWGVLKAGSRPNSPPTRPCPTGTPPPLPPKNVPVMPPDSSPPPVDMAERDRKRGSDSSVRDLARKPSIADVDHVFGPVEDLRLGEVTTECKWISFDDESPEGPPPPQEPAPPLPPDLPSPPLQTQAPPLPDVPPPDSPPPQTPPPPLPVTSPPPQAAAPPLPVTSPPPQA